MDKLLVTGGSGLLGSELKKLVPKASFPSSNEFDVQCFEQMTDFVKDHDFKVMLHGGAFTSPPKINEDPERALDVNIIGTANVVKLCSAHGIRLIYVCTDYVFRGNRGSYKETDEVFPVNKYAWSKLGGECAVRLYDNSLIVRTSFGPNVFPYEKAFVDQWTSRQSVSEIAQKLVELIKRDDLVGTLHVGGARRTVHDYAQELSGGREIGELSIKDVDFDVPVDTSLDCSAFEKILKSSSLS